MIGWITAGLSLFKGFQQSDTYEAQAEIAERNAQYASELATNNAEIERQNQQMKNRQNFEMMRRRKAMQESSYAVSGVLLDGTPSQYLKAQVEADELNMDRQNQASYAKQMNILYQGQQQRQNLLNTADAYRKSADMSLLGGFMGAGAGAIMEIDAGRDFDFMGSAESDVMSSAPDTAMLLDTGNLTGGVYNA